MFCKYDNTMKVFAYITFENERSPRHAARNTPAKKICHLEEGFSKFAKIL